MTEVRLLGLGAAAEVRDVCSAFLGQDRDREVAVSSSFLLNRQLTMYPASLGYEGGRPLGYMAASGEGAWAWG